MMHLITKMRPGGYYQQLGRT